MLPDKVKIGAHTFSVTEPSSVLKDGEEVIGLMEPSKNTIAIEKGLPPTRTVECILHECLHALLIGHDFQDEETILVILGEGLTSLIADNPLLFRVIVQTLSATKKTS